MSLSRVNSFLLRPISSKWCRALSAAETIREPMGFPEPLPIRRAQRARSQAAHACHACQTRHTWSGAPAPDASNALVTEFEPPHVLARRFPRVLQPCARASLSSSTPCDQIAKIDTQARCHPPQGCLRQSWSCRIVYRPKVSPLSFPVLSFPFLSCPLSPLLDAPLPSPARRGILLSATASGVLSFVGTVPSSLYIPNLDAFFACDGRSAVRTGASARPWKRSDPPIDRHRRARPHHGAQSPLPSPFTS